MMKKKSGAQSYLASSLSLSWRIATLRAHRSSYTSPFGDFALSRLFRMAGRWRGVRLSHKSATPATPARQGTSSRKSGASCISAKSMASNRVVRDRITAIISGANAGHLMGMTSLDPLGSLGTSSLIFPPPNNILSQTSSQTSS
jgi:hypothetical protein